MNRRQNHHHKSKRSGAASSSSSRSHKPSSSIHGVNTTSNVNTSNNNGPQQQPQQQREDDTTFVNISNDATSRSENAAAANALFSPMDMSVSSSSLNHPSPHPSSGSTRNSSTDAFGTMPNGGSSTATTSNEASAPAATNFHQAPPNNLFSAGIGSTSNSASTNFPSTTASNPGDSNFMNGSQPAAVMNNSKKHVNTYQNNGKGGNRARRLERDKKRATTVAGRGGLRGAGKSTRATAAAGTAATAATSFVEPSTSNIHHETKQQKEEQPTMNPSAASKMHAHVSSPPPPAAAASSATVASGIAMAATTPAPSSSTVSSSTPLVVPRTGTKDYSGRAQRIDALKEEAKEAYTRANYKSSIRYYTDAIALLLLNNHNNSSSSHFPSQQQQQPHSEDEQEMLAALYGNRAAALMMVGAYHAAAADCAKADKLIDELMSDQHSSSISTFGLTPRSQVQLRIRLSVPLARYKSRLGRAYLKMGNTNQAHLLFAQTTVLCDTVLGQLTRLLVPNRDSYQKSLQQSKRDALQGTNDVNRYHDCSLSASQSNEQSLSFLDRALAIAPASLELIVKKVEILASLKRWTEVCYVCESLACDTVKYSGIFVGDIAEYDPFPQTSAIPKHLKVDSLSTTKHISSDGKRRTLGANEATEASLRLPTQIVILYLRSLRLEERYPEAFKIAKLLEQTAPTVHHGAGHTTTSRSSPLTSSSSFSRMSSPQQALSKERDVFTKTMAEKDKGDKLFRNNEFLKAAKHYTLCLQIDQSYYPFDGNVSSNASSSPSHTKNNSGGRLHAVLFCNRAACHMATKKYKDAIRDCTAALEIRPNYLKARLRRARSHAKLDRFDDSSNDFSTWLTAVELGKARQAAQTEDFSTTAAAKPKPSALEAFGDISDQEVQRVRVELQQVLQAKKDAEDSQKRRKAEEEEAAKAAREEAAAAAAERLRQQRQQQQSNRYDHNSNSRSRNGMGGGGDPRSNNNSHYFHQSQRRQTGRNRSDGAGNSGGQRGRPQAENIPSPINYSSQEQRTHYEVLGLTRNATSADIKKAFRKMALQYHPDKNSDPRAVEVYRRSREAYDVLTDDGQRRRYDASIGFRRSNNYNHYGRSY